ncbi:hypothetical protein CEXT_617781 [Caerostris extrusa]|uniref:Uncharacterized protein n=1 Tax=Caerostris extrusa TaxID=172846 RepID=A0AAV4PJI6_CAEEX|nr:hypothetical protein CEXT_617781 [Caerostris extrusa]
MKLQHVTTSITSSSKEKRIAFRNYFRSAILNTTLCAGRFIIPPTPAASENTAVCPHAPASISLQRRPRSSTQSAPPHPNY